MVDGAAGRLQAPAWPTSWPTPALRRHGRDHRDARRRAGSTVTVDDDGPGIPPEMREEVFRPFLRLDEPRNQDQGGSGLGLAIARDVARSHGGDITLADSPLGGLRATVRVPVRGRGRNDAARGRRPGRRAAREPGPFSAKGDFVLRTIRPPVVFSAKSGHWFAKEKSPEFKKGEAPDRWSHTESRLPVPGLVQTRLQRRARWTASGRSRGGVVGQRRTPRRGTGGRRTGAAGATVDLRTRVKIGKIVDWNILFRRRRSELIDGWFWESWSVSDIDHEEVIVLALLDGYVLAETLLL